MFKKSVLFAAGLAVVLSAGVADAGDVKKGKKVFRKCKACHTVDAGKNNVGPSLHGVMGRAAGSVAGFKYSDAMMNSGLTWDAETLKKFVDKKAGGPKAMVPGTKMTFAGLPEKKLDDLVAYLETAK